MPSAKGSKKSGTPTTTTRQLRRISPEDQVAVLQRMERHREVLISMLEETNALVMTLGGEKHPDVRMGG